ncbi:carotenoid oxygenase family protein [uncultured Parasphingopyxis sp.]|uniref:carotenoid oxygenase family protein n=1 Tax=uncultured Parasphingopyxis sp. TaxID=1547918 RepID=UPI00262FEA8A|nr:carotenoid oxygenase family protein [uncultured Parasphingopyxis sp.]
MNQIINRIEPSLKPSDHPYLNGAWAPNFEEHDASDMEVIGTIPADLDGIYVRNTENPVHQPIGRYHPFDGDGMLHMMRFSNGTAEYKNRFVRTKDFEAEAEAGEALWAGFMEPTAKSKRPGCGIASHLRDSSSTDVLVRNGKILSTFWQCGEGYLLDPETLDTLGIEEWTPVDGLSAHPKLDATTGELMFFNYGGTAPYMHYGVVGADNELKHYIPIELPGTRLPHDMAISDNYSVLNDFPLFPIPEALENGYFVPQFVEGMKSRFAVLPRYGSPEDVMWFEAEPTYVLHWTNCWEDGDEVVLEGYFQKGPLPPPLESMGDRYKLLAASIDLHSLRPHLHRWRFNLKTGETAEARVCDQEHVEFGNINPDRYGREHRYVYSAHGKKGWFLFDGLVKHDLKAPTAEKVLFGEGRFGSEAPFVPRKGAIEEDDGYLVSFVTDMKRDRSECVVYDARDLEQGPLCQVILPHRICSGTHATWAEARDL